MAPDLRARTMQRNPPALDENDDRASARYRCRRRKGSPLAVAVAFVWIAGLSNPAFAQSVVGSKHDLADPSGTNETCVFCHTPHQSATNVPLWNRSLGNVTFTPYTSSTLDSPCPATPSPYSQACLSCHDGVNANNDKHDLLVGPGGSMPDMTSYPDCASCHPEYYTGGPGVSWIGTDLRNTHPISMTYPTPAQDPAFVTPPDATSGWPGTGNIKLYNGRVECPSCHNVHNPAVVPFLRKSNAQSALCLTCHIK